MNEVQKIQKELDDLNEKRAAVKKENSVVSDHPEIVRTFKYRGNRF